MFKKILIANRGTVACRIERTLRRLGVASVAVYTQADLASRHVAEADEAILIGTGPVADSYLDMDRIIEAAKATGAAAIHPGYGFLSESAEFAARCTESGLVFLGPTPDQMATFGLKHTARAVALENDVPLLPGTGILADVEEAVAQAGAIGYPVMLKSSAGGGGIGMRLVESEAALREAYGSVSRLAASNFGDAALFLERFLPQARHIEVQVFGDGAGTVLALGERDCSVQRRNQKVIEEAPAPGLSPACRERLAQTACRLMQAVSYRSAGTVEFLLDASTEEFFFLEVNTRLQVEHGVTEEVFSVDLVEWMVRLGAGELPPLASLALRPSGVALEARVYAEDPGRQFRPSTGVLTEVHFPAAVRVETWVEAGVVVSAYYDAMLAKLIVHADSRERAVAALRAAVSESRIGGVQTNLDYLAQVLADESFVSGRQTTGLLSAFDYHPAAVEVVDAGLQTTIQDWPGRQGYWNVGVPPSGPMDAFAHRLANRLVGNGPSVAALECTLKGPALLFHRAAVVALTGAARSATLDGAPIEPWTQIHVPAGATLVVGSLDGPGARAYVAIAGGFDVPAYLGSRATFMLGQFGGHAGRALRVGDVLPLGAGAPVRADNAPSQLPATLVPQYGSHWDIAVLYGPHGAPDFFTEDDIRQFFATDWQVHYQSSRTGVRLIGPKPRWARTDGGEAGLHPSNIHDNPYAIGAIDFTGDMPVILGPDGPSLGGFVCPAVIVEADLWKVGQLRAGDTVRFHEIDFATARARKHAMDRAIGDSARPADDASVPSSQKSSRRGAALLLTRPATSSRPQVVYRQAGDRYLLIEYGPPVLDIGLSLRAHALMAALQTALAADASKGIVDVTPGIRSLQIHFDPDRLARGQLLDLLGRLEDTLPDVEDMAVPSRIVHLPLAWDDSATREAIDRYMRGVRPDAPWCPSNIEFIRRINGLESVEAVRDLFFSASYLVLGLGDVYLGAPVATPIDPRHRLVTTKYNPARTWTPENAVGIGGAYLCVYGMEGPGGYQFVGRTVQMWNRWRFGSNGHAPFEVPWLLRFFDQLRFYPVSEDELKQLRRDFPLGRATIRIEPATFRLSDYRALLSRESASIARFKAAQEAAFVAERERWQTAGLAAEPEEPTVPVASEEKLPPGVEAVGAPLAGIVSKMLAVPGAAVAAGDVLAVIEAIKMEFPVHASRAGTVLRLTAQGGQEVQAGQSLVLIGEGG